MILSADQIKVLHSGSAVPVKVGDTDCVVLRRDVYDKVKDLIYDDSEMDPRDTYPAVLNAWDQGDSLDDYESYQ